MISYCRRSLIFLVVCLAVAIAGEAWADDTLSTKQRGEIEQVIQNYLLKNPAFMLEVFERVTRYQKEQEEKRVHNNLVRLNEDLYHDPNSVTVGSPEADVTIVEFFDYRCHYCKRNHPILTAYRSGNPGVKIVYKEYPILGPESVLASRAAIASRRQGKYWEFHDALMLVKGKLTEQRVFKLAAEVGLDVGRLRKDIRSPAISDVIQRNYRLAEALGVKGTPGFVIGDNVIPGFLSRENLQRAVSAARDGCLSC